MKTKIFIISVLALFVLFVFAGGALAKNKARPSTVKVIKADDVLSVDGGEPQPYFGPTPIMYEKAITACDTIHPDTAVHVIQLDQWGRTYYDEQQIGSMGRMIAVTDSGQREMVYMRTYGPFGGTNYRWITYNCKNWSDAWCRGDSGFNADGGNVRNAGYVNIAAMHDGREVVIYHRTGALTGQNPWNTALAVGDSGKVCSWDNVFFYKYDIPDKIQGEPDANRGRWPKMGIVYDSVEDRDYIHIAETETSRFGYFPYKPPRIPPEQKAYSYQRCYFSGNNLICESPGGFGPYTIVPNTQYSSDSISYFDKGYTVSPVVACSPVSQKLAIVYTKPLDMADGWEEKCNVWYFESTNNGDDWFASWPPNRINITNYPSYNSEFAYMDVAACYDYFDLLHIVWNTSRIPDWDDRNPPQTNLYHWSQATGITLIENALWTDTRPGHFNRNISKMSISAKDSRIYHPDSVYLFVTWTQFDTSDNGLNNYTNGEIYATCSADGGLIWNWRSYNLTGTHTPNCDSGNCLSEHWSSLAENMYNGDLHIEYVCDRDAGAYDVEVPPGEEGKCTADPMMYMHVAQLPFEYHCGISYTIVDPPNWTDPPIKVPIGGTRDWWFYLIGTGNQGGDYWVSSDNGLVYITSGVSGHLEPGDTATVEGEIFSPGEQFIQAKISISACDGQVYYELPLYAVGSDTNYYECATDSSTFIEKSNGLCSLYVCINSEQELYDLRWPEDSQKVMDAGGVIIATTNAEGKKIVGRQEWTRAFTGARDTFRVIQDTSWAEPTCLIQRIYGSKTYIWTPEVIDAVTNDIQWWWVVLNQQIILFHDRPGYTCPDWKKEQIIKQVWINWGRPPVWWPGYPLAKEPHRKMYFGYFADFDAPADKPLNPSGNVAGFDPARQIAWQKGWYNDTLTTGHPEYDGYYLGLALTSRSGQMKSPIGAQNGMNEIYVYPNEGWVDDSLYRLAATPGVNIQDEDSVTDRVWVLTADTIKAGTLNDTTWKSEFIMIEALIKSDGTPAQGLTALQNHIDTTRAVLIPEVFYPVCGDVDCDNQITVTDIVYLIAYKLYTPPGPPPCPPVKRGDIDGDGSISVTDIVYLIAYKLYTPPGPPPVCRNY